MAKQRQKQKNNIVVIGGVAIEIDNISQQDVHSTALKVIWQLLSHNYRKWCHKFSRIQSVYTWK